MITNERIEDYIYSLEREKPQTLIDIEHQAVHDRIPIIKRPTQAILRFLLRMNRPMRILEVGTAVGFSAILMSEYMPENASITTIEKMPARIKQAVYNIEMAKKTDKITLRTGDAVTILKELVQEQRKFDFIFMDAAKGQYINFLPDIMELLPLSGLLISDNVLQDGDVAESRFGVTRRNRTIHSRMREYLYMLTHMEEFESVVLPVGDGIILSTRVQ